ncbi:MAG: hypothetical protein FD167_335, partial [bacterium]
IDQVNKSTINNNNSVQNSEVKVSSTTQSQVENPQPKDTQS